MDIRLEVGKLSPGEYDMITVDGVGKCDGCLKAKGIRIDGTFKAKGSLTADTLDCDGMVHCKGDVDAQTLKIDGTFKCLGALNAGTIRCDGMAEFQSNISAKQVIIDGLLKTINGTKFEAQEIRCDGALNAEGQISADNLEVNGIIQAQEIVGDRIKINSRPNMLARILIFPNVSKAQLIEATTIELSGVTAKAVNGQDIVIGPNCKIDSVDCSGTLSIDKKSTVAAITGDYRMV